MCRRPTRVLLRVTLSLAVMLAPGAAGPAALADEPAPRYFVCPVKTDLQERLVPPKTDVCVVLDASAALREKELSPAGLGLDSLKAELRKLKVERTNLHFHLFCGEVPADRDGQCRLAHYAVIGFAHELGFPKVSASGIRMTNGNDRTWESQAAALLRKGGPADGHEAASGDADVKVYPVRTALSRYLANDVDCVIAIGPALDTDGGRLANKYRAVAAKAVAELKLPDRKRIGFLVRLGKLTDKEAAQLRDDIDRLGQELGSVGGYVSQQ